MIEMLPLPAGVETIENTRQARVKNDAAGLAFPTVSEIMATPNGGSASGV